MRQTDRQTDRDRRRITCSEPSVTGAGTTSGKCVNVCVCERERESEADNEKGRRRRERDLQTQRVRVKGNHRAGPEKKKRE